MRCLVLGGSSFVGGRLVGRLLAAGHDVSVLNRGRTGSPRPEVTQLTADRRDLDSMRSALDGRDWDAVFDVSGYVMATDAANFTGLLDLVEGRAGRYVFVSSVMAYAQTGFFPWYEDGPVRDEPPTTYGGFKVFAEQALMDRHRRGRLSAAVARPAAIYGPENNIYDMETAMFLRLQRHLPILLPNAGLVVTSYGHVDELADALLAMASSDAAAGEIFNITGVGVTAEQYVRTLADVVGAKPDIRFVPDEMLSTLERPAFSRLFGARHHGVISTQKARSRLGLPPERDFRTGHAETYEWFLSSPLASAELDLDDPLWGKGFDLGYEAEIAQRLTEGGP
jgi:nucleoside-diphosphate-sugar epimerase